ncbi:MAG: S9 family peptidase [Candidatus Cyclobacteriaceae bacterium M2_1C_046]
MKRVYLLIISLIAFNSWAQDGYQMPPKPIADLVDAPQTPAVSIHPKSDWILMLERPGYPSIEELAQPELRIAGLRINPRTSGPSRSGDYNGIKFKSIKGGKEKAVTGLPADASISNVRWSPDGKHIAFTNTNNKGISLWLLNVKSANAKQMTAYDVNDVIGSPFSWLSDNETIIYKQNPKDRGEAPERPLAPEGPVTQESTGKKAPVRTYQDLLEDQHDEELFKYYATVQPMLININTNTTKILGEPGIHTTLSPSPNGEYIYVSTVNEPFSYIVPYYRFPSSEKVMDRQGNLVREVAQIPLAENIPKGFGAVMTGPRSFTWRNDKPATLHWVEAQDEGDPSKEVEFRDRMFYLEAPFTGEKKEGIPFKLRYGGVNWGDDDLAIAYESWYSTRELITSTFDPDEADSKVVLFTRSYEDRYNDPGNFQTAMNEFGEQVLLRDEAGKLYLTGAGASPEGNRPFVRLFDLETKGNEELWRSTAPYYEYPVYLIDPEKGQLITRREAKDEQPNYYLRNLKSGKLDQITDFPHPYPELEGIEKQVVEYKRKDGVDLKGNLYLPKGYKKEDGPLPVLMWAYPSEFKSADAASQIKGSPYEFLRLYWGSPLHFVTRGYAIFDDPSMPVIGEGDKEPNDTFRKQLVMNAEAAIDKLVEMGIGDRDRMAIGGHSYGAFMTANLLAHSDLFAAGIARSGAYNRTLTPFGFQREERTYWDAPEVYYDMSPFMHADKINEPILLIHGAADNNSGTFPMQSERMFSALKGLGGKARLVMLPYESHGYRARESIMHMLWESDQLLEKYVKNKEKQEEKVESEK